MGCANSRINEDDPLQFHASLLVEAIQSGVNAEEIDAILKQYEAGVADHSDHAAGGKKAPATKHILTELVELGPSSNLPGDLLESPLHHAARRGRCDVIEVLLRYSPDLTTPNSEGYAAHHLCCLISEENEPIKCLEVLVSHGASIHQRTKTTHGDTCLHLAAQFGPASVVKALLDLGANVNEPNNLGKTSHQIALRRLEDGGGNEAAEINAVIHRRLIHGSFRIEEVDE